MSQESARDEIDVSPAESEAAEPGAKLVPVSESIRYRRRAQAAEQQLQELQAKLAESRAALEESKEQLAGVERRQRIDQLLMESEAVDLEAARLLTEVAVGLMEEPDVAEAVAELKRRKPFLFRRRGQAAAAGSSLSPRPRLSPRGDLDDAASSAVTSGSRRDLLRYLRLRRSGK